MGTVCCYRICEAFRCGVHFLLRIKPPDHDAIGPPTNRRGGDHLDLVRFARRLHVPQGTLSCFLCSISLSSHLRSVPFVHRSSSRVSSPSIATQFFLFRRPLARCFASLSRTCLFLSPRSSSFSLPFSPPSSSALLPASCTRAFPSTAFLPPSAVAATLSHPRARPSPHAASRLPLPPSTGFVRHTGREAEIEREGEGERGREREREVHVPSRHRHAATAAHVRVRSVRGTEHENAPCPPGEEGRVRGTPFPPPRAARGGLPRTGAAHHHRRGAVPVDKCKRSCVPMRGGRCCPGTRCVHETLRTNRRTRWKARTKEDGRRYLRCLDPRKSKGEGNMTTRGKEYLEHVQWNACVCVREDPADDAGNGTEGIACPGGTYVQTSKCRHNPMPEENDKHASLERAC